VQKALNEQGIEYELVEAPTYPRRRRTDVINHTGEHFLPAIEFDDGTWYREDSRKMAAEIRAARLDEHHGDVPKADAP
jgi:hypothetical protein